MNRSGDRIRIESTADAQMGTNSYLVSDLQTGDAVIIDAHMDPGQILELVAGSGRRVLAILLTHTDFDHIAGLEALRAALGPLPIAVHAAEWRTLAEGSPLRSEFPYPLPAMTGLEELVEGTSYLAGSLSFGVVHTPGHSPGGVTLEIERNLFTGDALFAGSIGRTDFSASDPALLLESIRGKLMAYDDDYLVYPGHGVMTTIGQERRYNPHL
ncbi:MAG TPA: MBL fold metallo-hydrolase [Candidatus Acidoferrales bacterium]|nr:MBL fold metallo-hydrolase [Candidatus Acidoferrales bacterium]